MSESWNRVASADEIPAGSVKGFVAEGTAVAIVNVDGEMYAVEDQCSHQDLPLADGFVEGNRLQCLYHGAEFDVCTGKALSLPAIRPIRTFPVEIRDGDVYVQIA